MTDTETNSFLSYLRNRLNERKQRIRRRIELIRLRRIRHKTTPRYTYCKNCGTRLEGMYCYRCGQYALDIEQPFWKYILQYFENVYQFDSKIWLTLYYLFTRPGFLTREFNAGKINSYVHPLRLFMFLSCLFFLFFFALIPSSLDGINWSVEGEVGESAEISAEDVVLQMDLSKDVIDFWYDDLNEKEREAAVDTTIYFCGDSIMQKMLRRMSEQLPSDSEDTLRFSVPKILIEEGYLLPITAQDSVYALAEDDTYFGSEPDEVKKELKKIETEMNFGAFVSWYSTYLPIILLLLIPVFGDSYGVMLCSFSLLGIGNALMQTSLNPLLSNIISGDRLASTLTFGQFVKAIASFLAPYLAMWGSLQAIPTFGLGWRVLFPIYMIVAVFAILLLASTPIEEEQADQASGFADCLRLLGKPFVLLSFLGIMCHVGIDVGTNTTAPKILMERLGIGLSEAGFATSLYFIFRTAGCLSGAFILRSVRARSFFLISVVCMLLAMAGLFAFRSQTLIYVCIALIGFGNSNVFSIIFSQALFAQPDKKNEVSGLMIMGLFGGTVFPLLMGFASDAVGQDGAVAVMTAGVIYLLFYTLKIKH